jgi:hypothetical protein
LRHFLDGGTEGRFLGSQKVLKTTIPELINPPRNVLWHEDVVLAAGLFPCLLPGARVYCPLYFFPTKWIARPLSTIKLLRLYQLPLSLDPFLSGLEPAKGLLFEDSPAPDLFTSIFHQLWGVIGGGLGLDLKLEEANEPNKLGEGEEVEGEEVVENSKNLQPAPQFSVNPADKLACPPCKSEGAMTVTARPEIYLVEDAKASKEGSGARKEGGIWQFDFGDGFGCGAGTKNADPLTDEDTVTSCASEETLHRCGGVEEHERVGLILYKFGPPFAVGDVIVSDVGKHGLQRAFVLRADHPRYQLRLADGMTVGTSTHESWLWPRYATGRGNPNGFAPDQDDPFVEIRQTINALRSRGKIGSYGVLGNAQLESLRRIEEAKEFAKAVKADNAKIPVHLWNDRVKAPGISKEKRDAALTGFRKLGLRLFLHGLVKDCAAHMKEAHGPDWMGKPRQH